LGFEIRVDNAFRNAVDIREMRRLMNITVRCAGLDKAAEVGFYVTDDATVKELNRTYRGIDRTTDVLSFALDELGKDPGAERFISPPDGVLRLGEVIVSYPQAVRQAEENERPLDEELAWLLVHGVLHLLGYDHDRPSSAHKMRALEKKVLTMSGKGGR